MKIENDKREVVKKRKALSKIISLLICITLIYGILHTTLVVFASNNIDSIDYYVDLSELTYTESGSKSDITIYSSDDYNTFLNDYNNGNLPNIYITEFLYDGVGQVKKISLDDDTGVVTTKTISTTAININTTGNIEFSGTATDTMIAVNTNGVTEDINLILNNVNLTSSSSTPVVMVYNKDVTYDKCDVTIKTLKDTNNYLTGGKLKKVSTMTSDKVNTYTAVSNIYSDTTSEYYYVFTSSEVQNLLYAQETANSEKVSEGSPYNYYKFSGAVGTDIAIIFEGEGYLEIASISDEGVETKGDLKFIGGTGDYKITSYDDGLNASTSGTDILINVNTMIVSVNADADEGDAIDSNGTIHIEGGTIYAFAHPTSQDDGLDSDDGTYINNGTVIAIGNMSDEISNDSKQDFIKLKFKERQEAGSIVSIKDTNGNPVMAFKSDRTFTVLTYSSPSLEKATYYVYKGGTIKGTETNGLYTNIDSYLNGTQQQWSGGNQMGGDRPGEDEMTPPDGDNSNGETIPDKPDGETAGNEETPPDKPDGDESNNGGTPPDGENGNLNDNSGNNNDGNTPPEIPNDENNQGQNQDDGEASIEFTISSTSHTFNNVTDYTSASDGNDSTNSDDNTSEDDSNSDDDSSSDTSDDSSSNDNSTSSDNTSNSTSSDSSSSNNSTSNSVSTNNTTSNSTSTNSTTNSTATNTSTSNTSSSNITLSTSSTSDDTATGSLPYAGTIGYTTIKVLIAIVIASSCILFIKYKQMDF